MLPLQGCGLITYRDRGSAAAAIQQLHGQYTFPGSDCPMVVEWMDLKKQRPAGVLACTALLALTPCPFKTLRAGLACAHVRVCVSIVL